MSKQYFTALTLFLILIAPLASSESNDEFTVDNNEPDMTTGDYFLYDLDMSGLLNSMQDEDIDEVRENSNTGMRMEYGGDSCLQTGWDDCRVGLMSWDLNLTMIFSSESGIDNDQAEMLMKMESTDIFSENKSEDTTIMTIDMWFSIDGEAYHNEIVTTEISITTAIGAGEPENVMAGDTWTTEKKVETTSNEKSRMNAEAWEYKDEVIESENITTNYNAESVSNVYIGNTSYQSLKIRSQDLGSEKMDYTYLANTGMPIKIESYENDTLQMIATLADYSWTNEPMPTSQDNAIVEDGLPGFTVFPALMSSLFALYFVARKE
jgi:hypothetical protein